MVFLFEIVTIVHNRKKKKHMIVAWNEEEKLPVPFKLPKTSYLCICDSEKPFM